MSDPRRQLPGVDVLLASEPFQDILNRFPRPRVVEAIRQVLDEARITLSSLSGGDQNRGAGPDAGSKPAPEVRAGSVPDLRETVEDPEVWAVRTEALLQELDRPSLRRVINATGVVLHTNLGRAPLSNAARGAMELAGKGYTNLEFDLEAGERGSRYVHCVALLRELTGAQDALVVNNNAAAVVLALNTVAAGREVLVSRGELVEIGGGFRIPDMLSRSGAVLREVGTTNRTRLQDYQEAVQAGTAAAILKVHRSNFRMSGFTEEATVAELVELAREEGLFVLHDLGSGLLADPDTLGLPPEPRATDSLKAGVGAVAISGDKLLGGPQAGILLGLQEAMESMRRNPLCRALRVDKTTLAGLEATLRHYLQPREALQEIPVLRMLAAPLKTLEERAHSLALGLDAGGVMVRAAEGKGVVGGGTFPGVELPSWTVRVRAEGTSAQELVERLRDGEPAVVARVEDQEMVLDVRTVHPLEDQDLVSAVLEAIRAAE